MKSLRGERLSSEYRKAVYEIISKKLKYKTDGVRGLVSVTKADVSPDLKNAKIYISVLGKNKEESEATFACIKEHAGYIRFELAHTMQMRTVPELHFLWDDTMEYGDKIAEQLKKLRSAVIFCHMRPDGDTLGSAMGLSWLLRQNGARCSVVCESEIPEKFHFLEGMSSISRNVDSAAEAYIAVDCSEEHRMGTLGETFRTAKTRIPQKENETEE